MNISKRKERTEHRTPPNLVQDIPELMQQSLHSPYSERRNPSYDPRYTEVETRTANHQATNATNQVTCKSKRRTVTQLKRRNMIHTRYRTPTKVSSTHTQPTYGTSEQLSYRFIIKMVLFVKCYFLINGNYNEVKDEGAGGLDGAYEREEKGKYLGNAKKGP